MSDIPGNPLDCSVLIKVSLEALASVIPISAYYLGPNPLESSDPQVQQQVSGYGVSFILS